MITPRALAAAYSRGDVVRLRTAGTTGAPRWVVRTAASWVNSFRVVADLAGLTGTSRVWIPGDPSTSMNAYSRCLADHVGATEVVVPGSATHVLCSPNDLVRLLERDQDPVTCVVAGDRLPAELATRAKERGHRVHHYYGATQLSFVAWGRDADSLRPFPGVDVQVVDSTIWVSSPWLCLREEGATTAVRSQVVDGVGWMSVGDRGRLTPDGRLVVDGRADAVTTGGATVVLADVEAALRVHAVGEVAVVGRPHPDLGTVLVAFCTEPADRTRLPALARRELPPTHRPRRWVGLDALPRTTAGKVDRLRLEAP